MTIVLDAWALLALMREEAAAERVESAWLQETPVMCSINLGEVLYAQLRVEGGELAIPAIERARASLEVVDPDWDLVTSAARFKAHGGLSYADCFAVATALRCEAPLWTGDPELVALSDQVDVVDLR